MFFMKRYWGLELQVNAYEDSSAFIIFIINTNTAHYQYKYKIQLIMS